MWRLKFNCLYLCFATKCCVNFNYFIFLQINGYMTPDYGIFVNNHSYMWHWGFSLFILTCVTSFLNLVNIVNLTKFLIITFLLLCLPWSESFSLKSRHVTFCGNALRLHYLYFSISFSLVNLFHIHMFFIKSVKVHI
jgi:hypothetical protein